MKTMTLLAGGIFTLATFGAQAHAHLQASIPKEGAVLKQTPTSILLTFSEFARITAVSIQKDQADQHRCANRCRDSQACRRSLYLKLARRERG